MAIPQWCDPADAAVWAPELAGKNGLTVLQWDVIIQAATWEALQKMSNRYGSLIVDVAAIPDELRQWTAVVSARIAMQARNVGGADSRVDKLVTESLRFQDRAVSGSLKGLAPTYSPAAAPKEYGLGSLVGTTVEQRMTIFQICRGPGPMGVEKFKHA